MNIKFRSSLFGLGSKNMQKNLIKELCLSLMVLYSGEAKPLSKDDVKWWSVVGGTEFGLVAGSVSAYFSQDIQLEKSAVVTCVAAIGVGLLSRWLLKRYLKPFTPQRRYARVQELKKSLKPDLEDKNRKSTNKTLAAVQEIRTLLEGIVQEIAHDVVLKNLHETCVGELKEIVELEAKIKQKIDYNDAIRGLCLVIKSELFNKPMVTDEALLSYAQMQFGTNWPLIEARNKLKSYFDLVTQSKSTFESIMSNPNCGVKMKAKCQKCQKEASACLQEVERLMRMVLNHQNYAEQIKLQEADRARKEQQALLEKKLAHERALEYERQRLQDARQVQMLWEKWLVRCEKNRRKEQDRKLKERILLGGSKAQIHATVKI